MVKRIRSWHILSILGSKEAKICYLAIPDSLTRKGALELAFKVRRKLDPDKKGLYKPEDQEVIDQAIARIRQILPPPGR